MSLHEDKHGSDQGNLHVLQEEIWVPSMPPIDVCRMCCSGPETSLEVSLVDADCLTSDQLKITLKDVSPLRLLNSVQKATNRQKPAIC